MTLKASRVPNRVWERLQSEAPAQVNTWPVRFPTMSGALEEWNTNAGQRFGGHSGYQRSKFMRICRMEHRFNKSLKAGEGPVQILESGALNSKTLFFHNSFHWPVSRNAYHKIHLAKFQAHDRKPKQSVFDSSYIMQKIAIWTDSFKHHLDSAYFGEKMATCKEAVRITPSIWRVKFFLCDSLKTSHT